MKNDLWKKQFWSLSSKESIEFHDRIKQGQFKVPFTMATPLKIPYNNEEIFFHFWTSNIGITKNTKTDNKLMRVERLFTAERNEYDVFWYFNNFLATIDKQIYWSTSYNLSNVKAIFVSDIIENFYKLLKELVI